MLRHSEVFLLAFLLVSQFPDSKKNHTVYAYNLAKTTKPTEIPNSFLRVNESLTRFAILWLQLHRTATKYLILGYLLTTKATTGNKNPPSMKRQAMQALHAHSMVSINSVIGDPEVSSVPDWPQLLR